MTFMLNAVHIPALVLIPTLIFTFTIALTITTSLLFLHFAHRLYIHLRASSDASSALYAWIDETRTQLGLADKVPVKQEAVSAMSLVKLEPNDELISSKALLNSSGRSSIDTIDSGIVMEDVKPQTKEILIDAKEWGGIEKV